MYITIKPFFLKQGAGIHQILGEIAFNSDPTQIDYVLCIGHFLEKVRSLYG